MLNNIKKLRGFTLVELLVVIAILGLLITASVVSIQQYQSKAVNIRVEADLSQIRVIATMIYTTKSNYNSLCNSGDHTLNDTEYNNLKAIEDDIISFIGVDKKVSCYVSGLDYCVQTPLITGGGNFCVDATGYAGEEKTNCKQNNVKCAP